MIKSILAAIGFGWSKWQTVEERKSVVREIVNPILGRVSGPTRVFVDVQKRTNEFNGKSQYRNVERS